MKVVEGSKLAEILGETEFMVNSFHHQIINKVAPDLIESAAAPDGVVEGIENKEGTVIGVQWHPEMLHRNKKVAFMNNLFKWVIDNSKK